MEWRERRRRPLARGRAARRAGRRSRPGSAAPAAAPFESLNLGLYTDDEPDAVRANRRAAGGGARPRPRGRAVRLSGPRRRGRRGASDARRTRTRSPAGRPRRADADGQVTANPALTPLVQVADCLPVALAGERGVAMLHCGWRGLAAGIVERGVEEVGATAAAIGPGIGPCCYEVGDEVLDAFAGLGRRHRRRADARPARGRAPAARRGRGRRGRVAAASARAASRSCSSPTAATPGRTGRQAGLVWVDA